MAGDWMAMRLDLADDEAVIHVSEKLGIEVDAVVGKLHRIWSWANQQSPDGITRVSPSWLDRKVGTPGFALALSETGWLLIEPTGIIFPKYDTWNSKSAKRRLLDSKRKSSCRKEVTSDVRKMSAFDADKIVATGEERREEKEVGGRRADRPTVSASPSLTDVDVSEVAEKAATAYQARRYGTPNPRAAYFPVLLQEAADVFDSATDKAAALQLFLQTCRDSPLPKDASFSDLAKSCGLKKQKAKGTDRPSRQFKDFTAERLAKQMAIS